jgi:hypothetical protein
LRRIERAPALVAANDTLADFGGQPVVYDWTSASGARRGWSPSKTKAEIIPLLVFKRGGVDEQGVTARPFFLGALLGRAFGAPYPASAALIGVPAPIDRRAFRDREFAAIALHLLPISSR